MEGSSDRGLVTTKPEDEGEHGITLGCGMELRTPYKRELRRSTDPARHCPRTERGQKEKPRLCPPTLFPSSPPLSAVSASHCENPL
jgi:hypothetical protein